MESGEMPMDIIKRPVIAKYWDRDDLIRRMRRIEGQARGVQAMLDRDEDCKDILTQLAAISGALSQVARVVSACGVVDGIEQAAGPLDPEQIRAILTELNAKGRL